MDRGQWTVISGRSCVPSCVRASRASGMGHALKTAPFKQQRVRYPGTPEKRRRQQIPASGRQASHRSRKACEQVRNDRMRRQTPDCERQKQILRFAPFVKAARGKRDAARAQSRTLINSKGCATRALRRSEDDSRFLTPFAKDTRTGSE